MDGGLSLPSFSELASFDTRHESGHGRGAIRCPFLLELDESLRNRDVQTT